MTIGLHLVTHFYNEELLLINFCKHHAPMFDSAICINSGSTDRSIEIIQNLAPHWTIVDSKYPDFNAEHNTWEVGEYERTLPTGKDQWKIALCTSEFIWHPDFRGKLEELSQKNPDIDAFGMASYCMVENKADWFPWGFLDKPHGFNVSRFRRYVHRGPDGEYSTGRHSTRLNHMQVEEMRLAHMSFCPWPEAKQRKLQIQTRMPDSDRQNGRGVQHFVTEEELDRQYEKYLSVSDSLMKDEYFRNTYLRFYPEEEYDFINPEEGYDYKL